MTYILSWAEIMYILFIKDNYKNIIKSTVSEEVPRIYTVGYTQKNNHKKIRHIRKRNSINQPKTKQMRRQFN